MAIEIEELSPKGEDVLRYRVGSLFVSICHDPHSGNPREEFDEFGELLTWSRDVGVGHSRNFDTTEEWAACGADEGVAVALIVRHCGRNGIAADADERIPPELFGDSAADVDLGGIGVVFATVDQVRKEFGAVDAEAIDRAAALLSAQLRTVSAWLDGDVYGYVIEDEDGNHVDSCWRFYEEDGLSDDAYVVKEAIDAAVRSVEQLAENGAHVRI